jgi:hypothetical protein
MGMQNNILNMLFSALSKKIVYLKLLRWEEGHARLIMLTIVARLIMLTIVWDILLKIMNIVM